MVTAAQPGCPALLLVPRLDKALLAPQPRIASLRTITSSAAWRVFSGACFSAPINHHLVDYGIFRNNLVPHRDAWPSTAQQYPSFLPQLHCYRVSFVSRPSSFSLLRLLLTLALYWPLGALRAFCEPVASVQVFFQVLSFLGLYLLAWSRLRDSLFLLPCSSWARSANRCSLSISASPVNTILPSSFFNLFLSRVWFVLSLPVFPFLSWFNCSLVSQA